MRIAFDYQIFVRQMYGGVSRYAYELAVELATACGQEVAVISPLYINRYLANARPELKVIGVPVPRLPKTGRIYHAISSLLSWPAIRYFHPDIVHETYYSARRMAPKSAKVVLTVYDMIHEKFNKHFSLDDPTSREKILAVGRADHIICISEQTRQDLIEMMGVDPAKTSVVHLGFTLTSQSDLAQKAEKPARPFLLYVGNRGGHKNFDGLVKAYAASTQLRNDFDLVCFGGGRYTSNEKDLFQRNGLSLECVRQVSGDDATLTGYYKVASAFVYPSLYEGFGIPPLEAMNFNCPVVCSNVSSIPEVVGNAAEMFNPNDPESIRMAIERVMGGETLRATLITRGQERIKHFSWERCAQETLDVYRRVLL